MLQNSYSNNIVTTFNTQEMMMKMVLAALATLAFSAPALAAAQENPFASEKTTLALGGLDLASADGQQRLAIRMDQAAREVCGDRLATVHLALDEQARACRSEVIADIRGQIEARQAMRATRTQVASSR